MSDEEYEPKTPRRGTRTRKSTVRGVSFQEEIKKKNHVSREEEEDEFSGEEIQIHDTVANSLAGKEIYSFNKVKKHERIITAPETPKKNHASSTSLVPKTPHHLRRKMGKGIKSTIQMDLSSEEEPYQESDSEYEASDSTSDESQEEEVESEEENESESEEEKKPTKPQNKETRHSPTKTKRPMIQKQSKSQKYIIKTEEYFTNNSNAKNTTSNHTLDKLKTPRLSQDQLQKLLSKMTISKNHEKPLFSFSASCKDNFGKWICLLHENFNLLVYGLGSKKNVLQQFQQEMLIDLPVIVINGFFPSLTLKDILDAIIRDMLDLTESPANVFDACDLIAHQFEMIPEQHLYLIVHNIEGDMLRNNKSQSVLARLSCVRNIHLITSIDHINAPLIWDHNKLSKFNFIWWDVSSFLPYVDETSFESSMMVQRTGNLALSSLRNVFLSLTSNSKGIYKIILNYQLENNTNQYYQGLLFKDLYSACREAFLVSSDLALRAQLTEFVDHKMVKLKRSADGAEFLMIPIANNLLQQFLSEQSK